MTRRKRKGDAVKVPGVIGLSYNGEVVHCPRCGGTHIWKKGYVPTKTGQWSRLVCVPCARSFYATARPDAEVEAERAKEDEALVAALG